MKKIGRFIRNFYCNVPLLNIIPRKYLWIGYSVLTVIIVAYSYVFYSRIFTLGKDAETVVLLTVVSSLSLALLLPLCFWSINAGIHKCNASRDAHKEFIRALRADPDNGNPMEKEFLCLLDKYFLRIPGKKQFVRDATSQTTPDALPQEGEDVVIVEENKIRAGIKVYLQILLSTYLPDSMIESLHKSIILVRSNADLEESLKQVEPICLDDALYSRVTRHSLIKSDMNALAYNLKPLLKVGNQGLFMFFKTILPNMYNGCKQDSFCVALTRDRHADNAKNIDQEAEEWYAAEIKKTAIVKRKRSVRSRDEIKKLSKDVIANIDIYMSFLAKHSRA